MSTVVSTASTENLNQSTACVSFIRLFFDRSLTKFQSEDIFEELQIFSSLDKELESIKNNFCQSESELTQQTDEARDKPELKSQKKQQKTTRRDKSFFVTFLSRQELDWGRARARRPELDNLSRTCPETPKFVKGMKA